MLSAKSDSFFRWRGLGLGKLDQSEAIRALKDSLAGIGFSSSQLTSSNIDDTLEKAQLEREAEEIAVAPEVLDGPRQRRSRQVTSYSKFFQADNSSDGESENESRDDTETRNEPENDKDLENVHSEPEDSVDEQDWKPNKEGNEFDSDNSAVDIELPDEDDNEEDDD